MTRLNSRRLDHRMLPALGVLPLLLLAACAEPEPEYVRVDLHWRIDSDSLGMVSCLDIEAATVRWTFEPAIYYLAAGAPERSDDVFIYDCADLNGSELVMSGEYYITAELVGVDDTVLATCDLGSIEVTPSSNQLDQCAFEVP